MQGVPQREDYHAEGDVYIHNQMVLKEATFLTKEMESEEKSLIRFAALCHDFGKTKTSMDLLYHEDESIRGNHFGHEKKELVEPMISEFCNRLKIPNKFKKIAIDVAVNHQRIHGIKNISPRKMVKMLNEINPSQKGGFNYINMIIKACEADAFGRMYLNENKEKVAPMKDYPQGDILIKGYEAYQDIKEKLSTWMINYEKNNEKKPTGDLIKSKVHEARVSSIKQKLKY
jgi:tRNA nucleotidyltransferase (CCA-adding enzyme)